MADPWISDLIGPRYLGVSGAFNEVERTRWNIIPGAGITASVDDNESSGWTDVTLSAATANSLVSARLATAAALPSYNRVTNTITATANGALSVDGVAVATGNLILLANGAAGADNGLYTVTAAGSGGTPFVLDRWAGANTSALMEAVRLVSIAEGTVNADTTWRLDTNSPLTLNTTSLTFSSIYRVPTGHFIGFGTPATAGDIRVDQSWAIQGRNSGGANTSLFAWGGGTTLSIGASGVTLILTGSTVQFSSDVVVTGANSQLIVGASTAIASGPAVEVHSTSSSARGFITAQFSSDANGARFLAQKARNTEASPAAVAANDVLFDVAVEARGSGSYLTAGGWQFIALTAGDAGTNPGRTALELKLRDGSSARTFDRKSLYTLTTTDATATAVDSFPVAVGQSLWISMKVVGKIGGDPLVHFEASGHSARITAGNVAGVGSDDVRLAATATGAAAGSTASIVRSVGAQAAVPTVQGVGGQTIVWFIDIEHRYA